MLPAEDSNLDRPAQNRVSCRLDERGSAWPTIAVCHASGVDTFNFVVSVDKDTLNFLASLIRSLLSWPVAFVAALVIFYKPLKHLIERLRRAKLPGVEIDVSDTLVEADARAFEARVDAEVKRRGKADDSAPSVPATDATTPAPAGEDVDAARRERERRQRTDARAWGRYLANDASLRLSVGKVLDLAWKNLGGAIIDLYDQSGDTRDDDPTMWDRVVYLHEVGAVDEAFVESWQKLRQLHDSYRWQGVKFTHNEAGAFANTARTLQSICEEQTAYPED